MDEQTEGPCIGVNPGSWGSQPPGFWDGGSWGLHKIGLLFLSYNVQE